MTYDNAITKNMCLCDGMQTLHRRRDRTPVPTHRWCGKEGVDATACGDLSMHRHRSRVRAHASKLTIERHQIRISLNFGWTGLRPYTSNPIASTLVSTSFHTCTHAHIHSSTYTPFLCTVQNFVLEYPFTNSLPRQRVAPRLPFHCEAPKSAYVICEEPDLTVKGQSQYTSTAKSRTWQWRAKSQRIPQLDLGEDTE